MKVKHSQKAADISTEIVSYIFVGIMVLFTVYPIIYTLLGAFKTNAELTLGESFFPKEWHPENFYTAFVRSNFAQYFVNSAVISIAVMVLAVITTSLAGYVFSRREFTGKKFWLTLYTTLMFIALGSVTLYPTYTMLAKIGINKILLGVILTLLGAQISNVMLVRGFVNGLPRELDEAAILDGCNPFQIYWKIIFPLIRPIIAVVALFSFRTAWNDYITTLVFSISMPTLRTLTVAVVQLRYSANAAAEWHIMLAGASISIIPILIVYLFCHKQFIGGLTAGAVKG